MTDPDPARRSFAPVVAVGLVGGGLAAYAGSRPWFVDPAADGPTPDPLAVIAEAGTSPLATPIALVLLAGWGVVLVSRGMFRRGVAGLTLLAAGSFAATLVVGFLALPDDVAAAVRESSARFDDVGGSAVGPWFWVAVLGGLMSVAAAALAVAWCPQWPEMGSRYDAPGADRDEPLPEDRTSLDLWKSMDEGRDPTA